MYTCIYIEREDDDDDDDDDDDILCMGRGQNPLTPGMFISSKYDIIGNLVGGCWWYTYPSEKYEFDSWDYCSQLIWKYKPNVPNHQPAMIYNRNINHLRLGYCHPSPCHFFRGWNISCH